MTRKDYELIAAIFHKNATDTDPKVTSTKFTAVQVNAAIAKQFADVLSKANPRFDRQRFLTACGVK